MIKRLEKIGDEYAIVIDRQLMDQLKFHVDTLLEMAIDGNSIVVTPVADKSHDERVKQAMLEVNARYAAAFKKLAE